MPSDHQLPYKDTPLNLEDQSSDRGFSALNEDLTEAKTREAFRALVLQRFAKWLDDVLAEEKPIEGVAAELLAELEDTDGSGTVGPTDSRYDLYSTWSEMTALTQEIKLQGRTFKDLSGQIEPLAGLGESIDRLLDASREAFTDVRLIAEEGREVRLEHENKLKHEAYDRARRELIGLIIDIRDKLIIGLRSTSEGRRKLDEYQNSSRLCKIFVNKIAGIHHLFEVVHSLRKGYRLGLDRLDETLQQLEVHEIACAGQPFDPQVMNAVDLAETDDAPDGMVLEVYRTGYMIDSEVLRPAQVKVARAPMQNMQFPGENRDREGTKKNSHLTLK